MAITVNALGANKANFVRHNVQSCCETEFFPPSDNFNLVM